MEESFVLIDGSYFIFYRYFAILAWWKHTKKEGSPTVENKEFLEKFIKLFNEKLHEISKKLNIDNPTYIAARDCSRDDIWRSKLFPLYKKNRCYDNFEGGSFFSLVYNDKLFETAGCKTVLQYPGLEADDCIAITVNHIKTSKPNAKIYIIASDADYMQLNSENVFIYNLKFKSLVNNKTIFDDPEKSLFCKIVSGDKSDNIPSIIPRCGVKTAIKYYENKEEFKKMISANDKAKTLYEMNRTLIDFKDIPEHLVNGFREIMLKMFKS